MVYCWFTKLLVYTLLLSFVYFGVDAQSLSDKDVIKEVLLRLDMLERQVREQHVKIESLREENVELKRLQKQDSDTLLSQNIEMARLREANERLGKDIDSLKDRDTQLIARINLLQNRDKAIAENTVHQPSINVVTGAAENNAGSNAKPDVQDFKSNDGKTTDDKGGIVKEYVENATFSRIRRHIDLGQTIAFFATRASSHAGHLGKQQAVIFDRTVTNVGQGYHNSSGIFTAPVPGVYVFSTTLFVYKEAAHFNFVINGQSYAMMYAHDTEYYETMSQTVIFNLSKGDEVAIQSADLDKLVYGFNYSTFSGFLLVSTEEDILVG